MEVKKPLSWFGIADAATLTGAHAFGRANGRQQVPATASYLDHPLIGHDQELKYLGYSLMVRSSPSGVGVTVKRDSVPMGLASHPILCFGVTHMEITRRKIKIHGCSAGRPSWRSRRHLVREPLSCSKWRFIRGSVVHERHGALEPLSRRLARVK